MSGIRSAISGPADAEYPAAVRTHLDAVQFSAARRALGHCARPVRAALCAAVLAELARFARDAGGDDLADLLGSTGAALESAAPALERLSAGVPA